MTARQFVSFACFAAAFMCNAAIAQTPRVVQIVVAVESQQFKDGLGATHRTQIESEVAALVATELGKPFPIFDWRASPGNVVPVATLTAAIIERQLGDPDTSDPEIKLVWRAKAEGIELVMPREIESTLYKASVTDRPIDDFGGKFRRALGEAAVAWVNSETNQNQLKDKFLRHVLIANKVVPTANSEFVVVPLPWQDVKMRQDSVLRVEYVEGTPDPQQMRFTLTGMAPRLADPLLGSTQTLLGNCQRGGGPVPDADRWNKCVAPLSTNPLRRVSVYADPYNYEPHPDVLNGVIVNE